MSGREPLLVATRSAGKLRELFPMFRAAGLEVVDLVAAGIAEDRAEDALEAYATFEENALAKARHFHGLTGLPTLADDSGLEVAALGGAPGVRSKRWSERHDLDGWQLDAENNRLLIERLAGQRDRRARYVCAAVCVTGETPLVARGEVEGVLLEHPRGAGGFGYDPLFVPAEGDGRTFGEMDREEKERLSHRARAFRALIGMMRAHTVQD